MCVMSAVRSAWTQDTRAPTGSPTWVHAPEACFRRAEDVSKTMALPKRSATGWGGHARAVQSSASLMSTRYRRLLLLAIPAALIAASCPPIALRTAGRSRRIRGRLRRREPAGPGGPAVRLPRSLGDPGRRRVLRLRDRLFDLRVLDRAGRSLDRLAALDVRG